MIIKATQRNTRQAPRKVRLAANTVKEMSLLGAIEQLSVMEREASLPVLKVLRQAIANATHNHHLQVADLTIKNIYVDGGPQYKRWRAVSRGRAHSITKKTSHITVELEKADAQPETKSTAKKAEVKVKSKTKKTAKAPKKAAQNKIKKKDSKK